MKTIEAVNQALRTACLAGVIAALTLLVPAAMQLSRAGLHPNHGFTLFCAGLMLLLVYGMTRYSRVCAMTLLLLYTSGKLLVVVTQGGKLSVLTGVFAMIFIFAMVRGVQATFAHHNLVRYYERWRGHADHTLDPRLFED